MNWTKESRELMNKLEFKIPAGYSDAGNEFKCQIHWVR